MALLSNGGRGVYGILPLDKYGLKFSNDEWEEQQQKNEVNKKINAGKDSDDEEDSVVESSRLEDVTVTLGSNNQVYTHRFLLGGYDFDNVRIIGGQTYKGATATDETQVVGKIGAALFTCIGENIFTYYETLNQDIYQAMKALFESGGAPLRGFKKKCSQPHYTGCLFISGVYVLKEEMGRGLGLEILRALINETKEQIDFGDPDIVLLCPEGDPPSTGAAASSKKERDAAFAKLESYFAKLGFAPCGTRNSSGKGQGTHMFFEPMTQDTSPQMLGNSSMGRAATSRKRPAEDQLDDERRR
jgi:hypothetical protein